MRFHIGFSKRISLKKIIEFLGFLFLVFVMATSCNKVLAWDSIPYDNFYEITTNNLDRNNNFEPYSFDISLNGINNNTWYGLNQNVNGLPTAYDSYFVSGLSDFSSAIYFSTSSREYKFTNTFGTDYQPSCNTLDSSTKSIDFRFTLYNHIFVDNANNILPSYNQNTTSTLFNVFIYAYDNTKDLVFSTPCTIDTTSWYNSYVVLENNVMCTNVFSGNNKYTIDNYSIVVINAIPFNDRYNSDSNVIPLAFEQYINNNAYNFSYQCNNDAPIVDGGFPSDDDPAGLGDIYDVIRDNYDTSLPGIDTSSFVNMPSQFSDLLLLPFDVVKAIINNSTGTCQPYEIDFSSLFTKWAPNHTGGYILRLPCMRTTLSNLLGNWYVVIDMLICFYLFYSISMYIINLLDSLTSFEDLFNYFYSPPSKHFHIDKKTGEVIIDG